MAKQSINLTFPVGRIVGGSLYKARDKDGEGKPLTVKYGPNAGQPRVEFWFALAIAKEPGHTHWAQTQWGQQIWAMGNQAFPNVAQAPTFAWKIKDGDSQIPNTQGNKPCDNEGWRGHWIVFFSGGYAPKVYAEENGGFVQHTEADFIKPGYFAEVNAMIASNESTQRPGIYINHSMVCFRAFGQEIFFGPDVASAGFGKSALPAGASAVPMASAIPMPAAPGVPVMAGVPPVPGMPQVPGMPAPLVPAAAVAHPVAGVPSIPGVPGGIAAPVYPSSPVPVVPNPQFLQVPPPAGAPQVPGVPMVPVAPAVPPAPVRQMTPLAQGASYEQMIAAGWNDAMLVANGMMLA